MRDILRNLYNVLSCYLVSYTILFGSPCHLANVLCNCNVAPSQDAQQNPMAYIESVGTDFLKNRIEMSKSNQTRLAVGSPQTKFIQQIQ